MRKTLGCVASVVALAAGVLMTPVAAAQGSRSRSPDTTSSPSRTATPSPAPRSAPMRFFGGHSGGNGVGAEWIAAEGTITPSTPRDFERFVAAKAVSYPGVRFTVVFDSPGGDLSAGLELGMMIRDRRFSTSVGRTITSTESLRDPSGIQTQDTVPGRCDSACAYAFLGGVDRQAASGEIGFHQFYTARALLDPAAPQFTGGDLGRTQALVGVVALYLKWQGIDPEVLFLASQQGPSGIFSPSADQLRRLKIVNVTNDVVYEPWTIEPVGQGAVVATRGRMNSSFDQNLALHCRRSAPSQVVLRGSWSHGDAGRPIIVQRAVSSAQASATFQQMISHVALKIGGHVARSHAGASGLLEARIDDDGTYSIAFVLTNEEVRQGIERGFAVEIGLPGVLGHVQAFAPPRAGLAPRLAIAMRSCV